MFDLKTPSGRQNWALHHTWKALGTRAETIAELRRSQVLFTQRQRRTPEGATINSDCIVFDPMACKNFRGGMRDRNRDPPNLVIWDMPEAGPSNPYP